MENRFVNNYRLKPRGLWGKKTVQGMAVVIFQEEILICYLLESSAEGLCKLCKISSRNYSITKVFIVFLK